MVDELEAQPVAQPYQTGATKKILIVDDDPGLVESLSRDTPYSTR